MVLSTLFIGLLLMIARMSGMFIILPVFGSRNIPRQVKVGLVFFTSYVMLPLVDLQYVQDLDSLLRLGYLVIIEFIVGLMFGLIMAIVLSSVYLAGGIIDRNIGFAMVSVVNPEGTGNLPVTANIFYTMALMVFFTINGHHNLFRVLAETYTLAPVGRGFFNIFASLELVDILQSAFVLGFKLAAPFIITVLVSNVLLGLLSKAMPGMNVFMIGMPFKIMVGLFLMIVLLPNYVRAFSEVFEWIWELLARFMVYIR